MTAFVALHVADPEQPGQTGTEVDAPGYARERVLLEPDTRWPGWMCSSHPATFGPVDRDAGTVTHASFWTEAKGGRMLTSGRLAVPRRWPAGSLSAGRGHLGIEAALIDTVEKRRT